MATLRGNCDECGEGIGIDALMIAWYGYGADIYGATPSEGTNDGRWLVAVTHPGVCAERYSEGAGDGCATVEIRPHEFAGPRQP